MSSRPYHFIIIFDYNQLWANSNCIKPHLFKCLFRNLLSHLDTPLQSHWIAPNQLIETFLPGAQTRPLSSPSTTYIVRRSAVLNSIISPHRICWAQLHSITAQYVIIAHYYSITITCLSHSQVTTTPRLGALTDGEWLKSHHHPPFIVCRHTHLLCHTTTAIRRRRTLLPILYLPWTARTVPFATMLRFLHYSRATSLFHLFLSLDTWFCTLRSVAQAAVFYLFPYLFSLHRDF